MSSMYEFMHQVSSAWHRLYWALMLVGSCLFVIAYLTVQSGTAFHNISTTLALNSSLAILGGIQIVYSISFYWFINKKSESLATFIDSLLFMLVVLDGLSGTEFKTASIFYVVCWLIVAFFSGMIGVLASTVFSFISVMAAFVILNFDFNEIKSEAILFILGSIAISIGSSFFWRTKYSDGSDQKERQLSQSLKSNMQQSEILIESISDGIIVTNTEGRITLMNPAAAGMSEWSVSEALGLDIRLVVKLHKENGEDMQPYDNPFVISLSKKEHVSLIVELTGRSNKKTTISLNVSPVIIPKSNEMVGTVAVMRDISNQKAEMKQRDDFISTAAHEMRTPVAAIEGYLSLALNNKVSTVDTRARSYLEKAHASTQNLGSLFQDLLTSSKAEDGRLSNHPAVAEMSAFLQQLTDDLKFTAEKKGLFVEFIIGSSQGAVDATNKNGTAMHVVKPLYYVMVDPDRIREVITNLFDNACKYTDQGKITIGLTGDNDIVQVYIKDTGAGIPQEDIPHLFQKFYRVDSSATRTVGGTGLGLFICRKIVELYHGRIWVESVQGRGSAFFINLPRLTTQRAMELQNAGTSNHDSGSLDSNAVNSMVQ